MQIDAFQIAIPDSSLADLQSRLHRTRWPDQPEPAGWAGGADQRYIRELVSHWQGGFDWRRQEAELNRLPQFVAQIGEERIHFLHVRGVGPAPVPLLITHGWPGSFAEMTKIIPMLTNPAARGGDPRDAFDVVVPSMPGYGFSSRPRTTGMNPFSIARLWAQLMSGLGYERFGAQGGDWGASVATCLGWLFPERSLGVHLNFIPGSFQPTLAKGVALSLEETEFLALRTAWADQEGGYSHIQGTKPESLAYALNDSPAGLAAWIAEKFQSWSDCKGDIETRFTKDELLTNIAIYWFTETIGSSMRLYRETRLKPLRFAADERVVAPVGIAHFAFDVPCPPRSYVERVYNVTHWTELARGGHFAALEEPELLVRDIQLFFRTLRKG